MDRCKKCGALLVKGQAKFCPFCIIPEQKKIREFVVRTDKHLSKAEETLRMLASFLEDETEGNDKLRSQVEEIITAFKKAESVMEEQPFFKYVSGEIEGLNI